MWDGVGKTTHEISIDEEDMLKGRKGRRGWRLGRRKVGREE